MASRREVDLEHGTKALHDGLDFVAAEDFAQPGDGGIADGMQLS